MLVSLSYQAVTLLDRDGPANGAPWKRPLPLLRHLEIGGNCIFLIMKLEKIWYLQEILQKLSATFDKNVFLNGCVTFVTGP